VASSRTFGEEPEVLWELRLDIKSLDMVRENCATAIVCLSWKPLAGDVREMTGTIDGDHGSVKGRAEQKINTENNTNIPNLVSTMQ
jgi:hypothetical protein